MKITKVKNRNLSPNGLRLDASLYLSAGVQLLSLLDSPFVETKSLKKVTSNIFYGNRSRRVYVNNPKSGIPFIKGADITKSNFSSLKLISRKRTKDLQSYALEEGWTLITRSGSIGNTAFVNKDFIGKAASDDIIRVCPQDIPAGFLYAYLSSKYGNILLTQSKYGAVIQHIEPEHIENLLVPIFPESKQQEIHNLIVESANLRVEANRLLEEAITIFDNNIGKSDFLFNYQTKALKINERNLFSNRLDAQFAIAYNEIKQEKRNFENTPIYSVASNIFVGNRAKRNYVDNGIPFLSSSDMMLFNPIRYAKQISKKSSNLNVLQVAKGDILISRSGTIGNTVLVGQELSGCAISEHALRLVIDKSKIAPEYVYCYLNTLQGKRLMEASSYGSVIITLNEDYVGNILLPILNKEQIGKIIEKVSDYSRKMDKATIKETQAIQLVEKEIESWQKS